jgi:hypothetical protein
MPPRALRVKVLRDYRHESGPPWAVPGLPCLASGLSASGAQVFSPACALGPHFSLGHGFGAATWPMGVWHKPSVGSKLVAHIQCERLRHALLCTRHGGNLLSDRVVLNDRSARYRYT